uniref:Beta-glucosidase 17-like n=1 Tax=Rhizophora mucronata TaxID=61149 RepID=A0A2P2ILJ6_RHIMU
MLITFPFDRTMCCHRFKSFIFKI